MTQRTLAAVIALPAVFVLLVLSWVLPLPYTVYSPGPTVDVLGEYDGEPIVQIAEGRKTYPTEGELRLTTVSETTRDANMSLWTLMQSWADSEDTVVPLEVAHPDPDVSAEEEREQSQQQMASSQDGAVAAALNQLDYDVGRATVASVEKGEAAAGTLRSGDQVLRVADTRVRTPQELVDAVAKAEPGEPLALTIKRDDTRREVTLTPGEKDGGAYLGIGVGVSYDFPFEVSLHIDPHIGGPSAGTMMALSVYDELTPGALTGGGEVAGTGTIDIEGEVGAIGGIRQKIAASQKVGADLFLVPAGNCLEVSDLHPDGMRLARIETLTDAIDILETWSEDHEADLPTCGSEK